MPWDLPTLDEIRERLANDYELRYQQAGVVVDAHTRGTGHTEKVNALAALAYGLRLNQKWVAEQQFVATMGESNLIKTGGELGLVRVPPAYATGNLWVSCNAVPNVYEPLPVNTVFVSPGGQRYRTTVHRNFFSIGTQSIPVVAMEAGAAGNLAYQADGLNMESPLTNFDTNAQMFGDLTGGADIETIDRFRQRVAERRKQPPMGGKYYDYVAWAKAASVDVTGAWVSPHEGGVGNIVLRFVTENLPSPIPSAGLVTTVDTHVQTQKPVEANVTVAAPTALPLDLTFTLLTPNTTAIQDAVTAELEDYLARVDRTDTTLYLNQIRAAISNTPGLVDFAISLAANVSVDVTEYATLGTTTFPA